jgi:hypothetical protein
MKLTRDGEVMSVWSNVSSPKLINVLCLSVVQEVYTRSLAAVILVGLLLLHLLFLYFGAKVVQSVQ